MCSMQSARQLAAGCNHGAIMVCCVTKVLTKPADKQLTTPTQRTSQCMRLQCALALAEPLSDAPTWGADDSIQQPSRCMSAVHASYMPQPGQKQETSSIVHGQQYKQAKHLVCTCCRHAGLGCHGLRKAVYATKSMAGAAMWRFAALRRFAALSNKFIHV